MNLIKKKKEVEIDGTKYVLCFDMKSIIAYKEITGRFFSNGIGNLFMQDDEEIIYFIASVLRRKENEDEPIGAEILGWDILYLLLNFKNLVIEIIAESLPSGNNSKKNRLTKK